MQKQEITQKVLDCGVVAVIRASSVEMAEKVAAACAEGGIVGLELTFTVPGAQEVIAHLAANKEAKYVVGAGTVLDAPTARTAILAGAKFIVSPSFDKGTAEICNAYQIPYIAGCLTPTEVLTAMKAGVDLVKIFPGDVVGPKIHQGPSRTLSPGQLLAFWRSQCGKRSRMDQKRRGCRFGWQFANRPSQKGRF